MKTFFVAVSFVASLASTAAVLAQDAGQPDTQVETAVVAANGPELQTPDLLEAPASEQGNAVPDPDVEGIPFNHNDEFIQSVETGRIDHAELARFEDSTPELRYRVVTLNSDYLLTRIRDAERNPDAPLELHLFPDTVLSAVVSYSHERTSGPRIGRAAWSGKLVEGEGSIIHLFVNPAGNIHGTISTPVGHFEISPSEFPPYHFIWQRDTSSERPID